MSQSRLIELEYCDPKTSVRLKAYADTITLDKNDKGGVISAIRFGGYPEMVKAMSDAIYGGGTVEAIQNGQRRQLCSVPKKYRRKMSHDGQYAVATLMANDDAQPVDSPDEDPADDAGERQTIQLRKVYDEIMKLSKMNEV